jgi:hypothetical protein
MTTIMMSWLKGLVVGGIFKANTSPVGASS